MKIHSFGDFFISQSNNLNYCQLSAKDRIWALKLFGGEWIIIHFIMVCWKKGWWWIHHSKIQHHHINWSLIENEKVLKLSIKLQIFRLICQGFKTKKKNLFFKSFLNYSPESLCLAAKIIVVNSLLLPLPFFKYFCFFGAHYLLRFTDKKKIWITLQKTEIKT